MSPKQTTFLDSSPTVPVDPPQEEDQEEDDKEIEEDVSHLGQLETLPLTTASTTGKGSMFS